MDYIKNPRMCQAHAGMKTSAGLEEERFRHPDENPVAKPL
ncbi:MAG: hypothetical protein QG589_210 [Patescibacteria group bacterium]|nr:hypothetical protein [Patescibacteria group bacterium]